MNFEELQEKVIEWAIGKGIIEHSNPRAQLLKAFSEIGEVADGEAKGTLDEIEDGVGDTLVCLIIYCHFYGLKPSGCLEAAYNQIKNRKGRMAPSGVFIKEQENG